jgi:hypothetical protein
MKYFLVFFIFINFSCASYLNSSFDYNISKDPWIHAFKDRVFIAALKEAYKTDSLIFQLIEKKDALNTYDGLTLNEMKIADDLGKSIIKNMPIPLMCENCPNDMNYYISTSLHYYESKELNLITKKLYRLHKFQERKAK